MNKKQQHPCMLCGELGPEYYCPSCRAKKKNRGFLPKSPTDSAKWNGMPYYGIGYVREHYAGLR